MTPVQAQLIEAFWSTVRRTESVILENGHRSCPADAEDRWNFELEDAYESIHPLLVCLSRPQVFMAIASLPNRQGPFTADNAHQALMLILNPPEALFGNPSLVTSKAYVQVRTQAESEVKRLVAMDSIPVAVPALPKHGTIVWDSDFKVTWELPKGSPVQTTANEHTADLKPLSHYMSKTKVALLECLDPETPQTAEELRNKVERRHGIECADQTVRLYMSQFKKLGLVDTVKQGYIRRK